MEHLKQTLRFVELLVNLNVVLLDQLQLPLEFGNFGRLRGRR